ncbi:MAG: hypothetical protein AAFU61_13555 [Pseudomonadota bacterium]
MSIEPETVGVVRMVGGGRNRLHIKEMEDCSGGVVAIDVVDTEIVVDKARRIGQAQALSVPCDELRIRLSIPTHFSDDEMLECIERALEDKEEKSLKRTRLGRYFRKNHIGLAQLLAALALA